MTLTTQTSTRRLRRYLAFYAFALAIALTVLAGVLLIMQNRELTSADVESTIGIELIAAAAFSIIFTTLTAWIEARDQNETFAERIREITAQILADVRTEGKLYNPVASFPPSDSFDDGYNRAVMAALERTRSYDFCGPSARFVPSRLYRLRHAPQQVRVAMVDPSLSAVVTRRASDRRRWASSELKTLDDLETEFRDELLSTTVALFDFRHTCPVYIVYASDMVVYRYEITDEYLFYSWYHGSDSVGKEMPRAEQFTNESMYYQILSQEMSRRFELISNQAYFTSGSSEADLCALLGRLTGKSYSAEELDALRRQYRQMTSSFGKYLNKLGYTT